MNAQGLTLENRAYAGTTGVSQNARPMGFVPGFKNSATGECCCSRFANGMPAPIHILEGLPSAWIRRRGANGEVEETEADIIAGFLLEGRFFTREEAAQYTT